jgi:S1-C subfamily serine protease
MSAIELSVELSGITEDVGRRVVRVERRAQPVSGSIVAADGQVVAVSHTVERDEDVELGLPDGRSVRARVVGRDPGTDLALLQAEASGLEPVSWAELDGVRVGQLVLGVYRPGRTTRASLGIVGALGDAWRTRFGGRIDRYIEASLPLAPGFSGGLMVDVSGRALGLSTSGLLRGVALAIPAATVRRVMATLLQHGRVKRGYLGIGSQPVALPEAFQRSLGQATGLLVVRVVPGSTAAQAGIMLGDVVVAVDGQPVTSPLDLLGALDEERVGQRARLSLFRGGELREVEFTVAERAE